MNDENELLEPLATEAGQEAIVRAIRDISSLEYAVRAEQAASTASAKAGEASQSAIEASEAEDKAKDWATKTDTYVEQQIITIPPAQEGEEPTTETINLYSARYYAALAQDIYNNMSFDSVPTENSNNMVSSGTVYSALDLKADKSTTYTKTEVDTALSNVQGQLTFDNVPTANSDNPVKSSGIKTALDGKQDTLTFDSTPTANSTNPVTSGGIYTALQNVDANIEVDDEITEDSDNPVTSAAIYEALQNFTPSGGGGYELEEGEFIISESPIGTVIAYSGNIIPSDWLLCDGSAVSRTTYSELFAIIGTTYGIGDGSTTFNLPDLTDKFIQGSDTFGTEKQAGLPNITGSITKVQFINGCTSTGSFEKSDKLTSAAYSGNTDGAYQINFDASLSSPIYGNSTTVQPPAIEMKYIIRCKGGTNKVLSEQMYSNVLYENASGWSSGNITLSNSLDNYDFIEVQGKLSDFQSLFSMYCNINQINNDNKFLFCGYEDNYMYVNKISSTELQAGTRYGFSIYKIIGHKMAKGGYSGIVSDARMTVKSGTYIIDSTIPSGGLDGLSIVFDSPMPDTNYYISMSGLIGVSNASRAKFFYGNKTVNGFDFGVYPTNNTGIATGMTVDWIAIRPNSYTREGMVEDVLFSNANGVNSGTINLSGNISDYDLITFQVWTGQETYACGNPIIQTSTLLEFKDKGGGYRIGADRAGLGVVCINVISDNQFNLIEYTNNAKIYKITGIKFGRYVSGVAVDTTVTQNSSNVVTSGAVYDALQNIPSGGGSSITVDSTITQGGTNPVESAAIYAALGDKADQSTTYTKTEVDTALASKGDVTTNTDQNITGTKTFVGSKKVGFKQSAANDKLGFTLYGNTGTERGYLEFNPTNTIDGVAGLMTLGNYATSAGALTHVGFRRYSNISGANGAYNLLTPLIADAKSPFSLTTTYTNFYLPLGFTDGTTTVRTAKSGLVDLSPLLASLEARIAALEGN